MFKIKTFFDDLKISQHIDDNFYIYTNAFYQNNVWKVQCERYIECYVKINVFLNLIRSLKY